MSAPETGPELSPFQKLLNLAAWGLVVAALAGSLWKFHWFFALFGQFLPQQALFLLLLLPLAFFSRTPIVGKLMLCFLLILFQARRGQVQELIFTLPPAEGEALKIIQFNVHGDRSPTDEEVNWLLESEADFLLFQEFTPGYQEAVGRLQEKWPHVQALPQEGFFGLAIYSRKELLKTEVHWVEPGIAILEAQVLFHQKPLSLFNLHPPPGFGSEHVENRRKNGELLKRRIAETEGRVLVAGDFNDAPFSPDLMKLETETGLINIQRGLGYKSTWKGWTSVLSLSIDHLLMKGFQPKSHAIGPDFGSDHLPVISEVVPLL